jgi:NAD(P)H-nitrite reductase large subunit
MHANRKAPRCMPEIRCICHNLSLAGLRSYALRHGLTSFEELQAQTGCGTSCGTCRPYIEEMLRTGRVPTYGSSTTELADLFPEDAVDPRPRDDSVGA